MTLKRVLEIMEILDFLHGECMKCDDPNDLVKVDSDDLAELIEDVQELLQKVRF